MVTLALSMDRYRLPVRALPAACFELVKKILIAIGVVAALLGGRTLAADLPPPLLPAPVPKAVPSLNWSGPYFGIGIGGRANAVDANVTSATVGTPPTPIPLPGVDLGTSFALAFWQQNQSAMQYLDNIAIHGSIYGGWNFQVAPAWVIGSRQTSGLPTRSRFFMAAPIRSILHLALQLLPRSELRQTTHSASGRLGMPACACPEAGSRPRQSCPIYRRPRCGPPRGYVDLFDHHAAPDPERLELAPGSYFGGTLGPAVITHSATKLGWTAGLGVDMWLWSNWMVRMHYRYADFGYLSIGDNGAFSFTDTRTCSGCLLAANTP